MKISVIGLGKLGVPMAALLAKKGYEVIGADVNGGIVDEINSGKCPIYEPGLEELLLSVRLKATKWIAEAVADSDVTFIIVPTPSDKNGSFSNDYILSTMPYFMAGLKGKNSYHLVVITSTVMPGSMENVIGPALARATDREVGKDIGLCYSPEFIALGNVLKGMSQPDAVLIGESDKKDGDILEGIYKVQCDNKPPICRMSWWNAEIAKLSLNVFVTTKISIANTIANACEGVPGGNVDAVTDFLGLDGRIGAKYFKGGLGFSGTCFPRDNEAYINFAKRIGALSDIQKAVSTFNDDYTARIVDRATTLISKQIRANVAILGLAFKPGTNVVEQSPSLKMAKLLADIGHKVHCHDPQAMLNAAKELRHKRILFHDTPEDCMEDADLCILATPWPEYKDLSTEFKEKMNNPVVLDCWRILDKDKLGEIGVRYHAVGVSDN